MTREEAKKFIKIITAFGEGKEIQYKNKKNPHDYWHNVGNRAIFSFPYEFRITPKPEWEPKFGEWIYVRDHDEEEWEVRLFVKMEYGRFGCIGEKGVTKEGDNIKLFFWNQAKLKNKE